MSPRYSTTRSDHIEYCFWLVFDDGGGVRMCRRQPSLNRAERGMSCTAKLPRSLFSTPSLRAVIDITDHAPSAVRIDLAAAGEALRQAIGCDVDLRINTPEPEVA